MSLKDFITATIATAPAPIQWIHDPCGLAMAALGPAGGHLTAGGNLYHVLAVSPDQLLRFRYCFEQLRATSQPVAIVSSQAPLAVADIVQTCRLGAQGRYVNCSPKAILESPPPLGTGRPWNDLVNSLDDEFPALLEALVRLTERARDDLKPNTRSDAICLIVAARLHGRADQKALDRILAGRLGRADLLALALQWEESAPGDALRALWLEFCDSLKGASHSVFDKVDPSDQYDKEKGKWLAALQSLDGREQCRNYLWTTFVLHRYRAGNLEGLRAGVIGPDLDRIWTRRIGLPPLEIEELISGLAKNHTKLFRQLAGDYERWLRSNPAVMNQLLVALELRGANPSLTRALQVAEQEESLTLLFVAVLRVVAEALCSDLNVIGSIGAGIWGRVEHHRRSAGDVDREAIATFDGVYQMADRLRRLDHKDFLSQPEIATSHELWLEEIYPRYLAGLDLLAARVKISNDLGRLLPPRSLSQIQERCIQTLDDFNMAFCTLVETKYQAWAQRTEPRPPLTCDLIDRIFVPEFSGFVKSERENVYLVVFDGMRYDTWQELRPLVEECFRGRLVLRSERAILSILPSSTQYSRKAIFAGAFPAEWPRRANQIDPETSEIRLLKHRLQLRHVAYADRLPDNLMTGGESEMKEEDIRALIKDKQQVIKPLIFNVADDQIHDDDADLKTLHDKIVAEFKNKIRPILNEISDNSLVIFCSDHGFADVWGSHQQTVPSHYGAIRWRYAALRKVNSELGCQEDVVAFRSKDIKLNVEYSNHLESSKEFGEAEASFTIGVFAYPLYLFCKPKALLARKKAGSPEELRAVLRESETVQGKAKLRYEHGGISLQEMVVPVAVFGPGKITGRPDVRVAAGTHKYVDGTPAVLTLSLSNYGNAPAEQIKVSVEGVGQTGLLDRLDPGEKQTQQLDFPFVPSRERPKLTATVVFLDGAQQVSLITTIDLTVEADQGRVERRRLF